VAVWQANGTPYDVGYGQNISGSLSIDTVSMAGLDIEGQTFGEITQLRNQWYLKLPKIRASKKRPFGLSS